MWAYLFKFDNSIIKWYNLLNKGGGNMKLVGYICDHCQDSYEFQEDDIREEYLCPKCGKPMWYFSSYEIDESTNKKIGDDWYDPIREAKSPAPFSTTKSTTPTITCPYCKSTDCKKISGLSKAGSVALWGIFALGKTTKQFHCNNCKADF